MNKAKAVSLQRAVALAARARKSGKKIVTTNGCFDILHVGHVRNLAYAKSLGDLLFVAVNSDASVRRLKGAGRPINPARERMEMLVALESIDYVFEFSTPTPEPWIEKIRPQVHVKGSDRATGKGRLLESEVVERHGGQVKIFPHIRGRSTTGIIKRVRGLRDK